MAIMLTILKYLGFIYYTVATTTIVIFLHLFFRMNRRPNQYFYKLNKPISKPILTFYTLLNLFLNYIQRQKQLYIQNITKIIKVIIIRKMKLE